MLAAIVRPQVWTNDSSTFSAQKRSWTTTSSRHALRRSADKSSDGSSQIRNNMSARPYFQQSKTAGGRIPIGTERFGAFAIVVQKWIAVANKAATRGKARRPLFADCNCRGRCYQRPHSWGPLLWNAAILFSPNRRLLETSKRSKALAAMPNHFPSPVR